MKSQKMCDILHAIKKQQSSMHLQNKKTSLH